MQVRTACESGPSMPARARYWAAYASSLSRTRAAPSAACSARGRNVSRREQTPGRAGAARLEGARLAVPAGEAGPHHPPPLTGVDGPALARMAGRTGRNLSVPIEPEVLEGEGARRSGLPLLVLGRWPNERHIVVADAGHQVFRIHIPGVHQMRARQQILGGQLPMHLLEGVAVDNRRRRGLDVGDERGGRPSSQVSVTCTL